MSVVSCCLAWHKFDTQVCACCVIVHVFVLVGIKWDLLVFGDQKLLDIADTLEFQFCKKGFFVFGVSPLTKVHARQDIDGGEGRALRPSRDQEVAHR